MLKDEYKDVPLEDIKDYAEAQFYGDEDLTGMPVVIKEKYSLVKNVLIVDPWMDETGFYDLTDEEAIATYGQKAVEDFCIRVAYKIRGSGE